jgi:hypothetical protein
MVALKYFVLAAASVVSVLAIEDSDITDNITTAVTNYWNEMDGVVAVGGAPTEKRDTDVSPRNDLTGILKDPYCGRYCNAPFTEPPCETKCNRNLCFRGFLNGYHGQKSKVRLTSPLNETPLHLLTWLIALSQPGV